MTFTNLKNACVHSSSFRNYPTSGINSTVEPFFAKDFSLALYFQSSVISPHGFTF